MEVQQNEEAEEGGVGAEVCRRRRLGKEARATGNLEAGPGREEGIRRTRIQERPQICFIIHFWPPKVESLGIDYCQLRDKGFFMNN